MRLFEVIAGIGSVLWLVVLLWKPVLLRTRVLVGLGAGPILLALLQIGLEGARLELIPIYFVALASAAMTLFYYGNKKNSPTPKPRRAIWKITLQALGLVLSLVLIFGLPSLLPVFKLPEPSGSYKVGTVTYDWTDPNREETYTLESGDHRELMVQVWYPADRGARGPHAPYVPKLAYAAKRISQDYGIPGFLFSHWSLVKTHSLESAALPGEEASYPVIVLLPGLGGLRYEYTFLAEELASQGYVVVGVEHTYQAIVTVFPDGRTTGMKKMDMLDLSAMDKTISDINVKDAEFVLDRITALNEQKAWPFAGRLDLDRIGLLGHSVGGATAAQLLLHDSRIKAGVNMDGSFVGGEIPVEGLGKPFMLMGPPIKDEGKTDVEIPQSVLDTYKKTREEYEEIIRVYKERQEHALAGNSYYVTIKGTSHMSYSDFPLYSPYLAMDQSTPVSRAHLIINAYIKAFFDKVLSGKPSDLIDATSHPYPEASVKVSAGNGE